jgi:hypothetical protein
MAKRRRPLRSFLYVAVVKTSVGRPSVQRISCPQALVIINTAIRVKGDPPNHYAVTGFNNDKMRLKFGERISLYDGEIMIVICRKRDEAHRALTHPPEIDPAGLHVDSIESGDI